MLCAIGHLFRCAAGAFQSAEWMLLRMVPAVSVVPHRQMLLECTLRQLTHPIWCVVLSLYCTR